MELAAGVESRPDGLAIPSEISFNDWRRLGEQLLVMRERVSWSIGDWWAFGERFGMDYHYGVTKLEGDRRSYSFATLREYARVCTAFPVHTESAVAWRRPDNLSFAHHHHVLSIREPSRRMGWLDEAIRQGWSVAEMREELRLKGAVEVRVLSFSVKVVEEHYALAISAAERRAMDPRAWVLEAIREHATREEVGDPSRTSPGTARGELSGHA